MSKRGSDGRLRKRVCHSRMFVADCENKLGTVAEEQSVAAVEGPPALPSVAEFAGITSTTKFRQRAKQLGLVVKVGFANYYRDKHDIVADYQKKLQDIVAEYKNKLDTVAEEQSIAAAEGPPALPSVAEFARITPMAKFRKRAKQLGLVVYGGCAQEYRYKSDIVDDYKKKFDRMHGDTNELSNAGCASLPDFQGMRKIELRACAASLGVHTHHQSRWRTMAALAKDCEKTIRCQ